jgi:hypothetical protein
VKKHTQNVLATNLIFGDDPLLWPMGVGAAGQPSPSAKGSNSKSPIYHRDVAIYIYIERNQFSMDGRTSHTKHQTMAHEEVHVQREEVIIEYVRYLWSNCFALSAHNLKVVFIDRRRHHHVDNHHRPSYSVYNNFRF